MLALPETLAHDCRLCADHFDLDSSGQALPLVERQTKSFRNSKVISFDPGHFDLGLRRFVTEVRDKLQPPNQLLHRFALPKKAIVTLENLNTPHDFACSPPLQQKVRKTQLATHYQIKHIANLLKRMEPILGFDCSVTMGVPTALESLV